ncbi:MAG: hypothetical protein AB7E84_09320 [Xanthobacteraceae bacterium]
MRRGADASIGEPAITDSVARMALREVALRPPSLHRIMMIFNDLWAVGRCGAATLVKGFEV